MRVRVEASGVDEVRRSLILAGQAGVPVAKRVLKAFTTRVVPRVRERTPVDPGPGGGDLRDSVRATRPTATKRGVISAGVVAGGEKLERLPKERDPGVYTIQQHEDLTLHHTQGGPKFVEIPFMQEAPSVPGELLAALDAEIQK